MNIIRLYYFLTTRDKKLFLTIRGIFKQNVLGVLSKMPQPPATSSPLPSLGQVGEVIACKHLKQQGYVLLACNWRYQRLGEVDIVAKLPGQTPKGIDTLVFVEVKTRKSIAKGIPAEAVNAGKQEKLIALAQAYLAEHSEETNCAVRFDVISVMFPGNNRPAILEHLPDAFRAG